MVACRDDLRALPGKRPDHGKPRRIAPQGPWGWIMHPALLLVAHLPAFIDSAHQFMQN